MKIGSLFSGYGGLDLGVQAVLGGEVEWHVEFDPAPSKILAHHWPDVPNYGDVTKVDWATVEPVDILTGGYPCQPFSAAGKRKGTNDDRHLWPYVRECIRALRPRYTILENVAGHRSLGFDRVLGDLAEDGLHARWVSVRASDVGAPHHRERLFILVTDPAYSAGANGGGPQHECVAQAGRSAAEPRERASTHPGGGGNVAYPEGERCVRQQQSSGGEAPRPGVDLREIPLPDGGMNNGNPTESGPAEVLRDMRGGVLPQEVQRPTRGQNPIPEPKDMRTVMREQQEGSPGRFPQVEGATNPQSNGMRDMPLDPESSCAPQGQEPGEQRGGKPGHAVRELPPETSLGGGQGIPGIHNTEIDWGPYTAAIRRWERVLGRPAPNPAEPNTKGKPRLSAAFAEYLMGLPPGHVTDPAIGISRADQLKAIGNGVCPQQAALALNLLFDMETP